jgi:hypothetical protein
MTVDRDKHEEGLGEGVKEMKKGQQITPLSSSLVKGEGGGGG